MPNFIDYIKNNGNETFKQRQFNEVDNLVLSMLSYVDFSQIVMPLEEKKQITIQLAAERYSEIHKGNVPVELNAMAESIRFGQLMLSDYEEMFDSGEKKVQFAAMHISSLEGWDYVAFRGTDNSLTGWRENFMMSYQIIPSQRYALDYLKKIISKTDNLVYVGGHSKGGMLAVYAASRLDINELERVIKIYSNDGPGLCSEVTNKKIYTEMKAKLIRISPDFSVVGMLFNEKKPDIIVHSNVNGVKEHDAFTWQIEDNRFRQNSDLKNKSKVICKIIDEWLKKVSLSEREIFVNDLFDAIEREKSMTLNHIFHCFAKTQRESKQVVGKLLGTLISRGLLSFVV